MSGPSEVLTSPDDAAHSTKETGSSSAPSTPGTRWRLVIACTIGLAVVPVVTAVVRALLRRQLSIGDNGLLEIRSHDVLTRHHPLLGTWSSASVASGRNVNHPGPLLFDAVALPVKVLGGGAGLPVGVALVNIAAVLLAAVAGYRLAGRFGLLAALATASGLAWSLGSELLIDVWQPHVLVLPCFAFVLLAASAVAGDDMSLPVAAGVGSFLVQTHLSYVVIVPVLLLLALGSVVVRDRLGVGRPVASSAELRSGQVRRVLVWTGVVVAVAWAQPIAEQLVNGRDGNLARLVSSGGSESASIGPRLGARLIAAVVALPPWWSRSSFADTIQTNQVRPDGTVVVGVGLPSGPVAAAAIVALLTLVGLAAWWALRRRDAVVAGLCSVVATALAAAWITTMVMPTGVFSPSPHQMRWLWPISALVTLTAGITSIRMLGGAWVARGAVAAVALVAVFSAANVPYWAHDHGPTADRAALEPIRRLHEQLDVLDRAEIYLFDPSTLRFSEPFSGPLLAELRRRGLEFVVDDEGMVRQLGSTRRNDGSATVRLQLHERASGRPVPASGAVVAEVSGLDPDQLAELERLRQQVAEADGVDAAAVASGAFAGAIELGIADPPALPDPVIDRYLDLERRLRLYSVALVALPVEPA